MKRMNIQFVDCTASLCLTENCMPNQRFVTRVIDINIKYYTSLTYRLGAHSISTEIIAKTMSTTTPLPQRTVIIFILFIK